MSGTEVYAGLACAPGQHFFFVSIEGAFHNGTQTTAASYVRKGEIAMKLARRAIDDPKRVRELEASFDDRVSELLAEANDAGYATAEATRALLKVVQNQVAISNEEPDPADDPAGTDMNSDSHPLDPRAD